MALSACSTTGHGTFTPVTADDGQAIVYIYRPASTANAFYSPDIVINGEVKFAIKNANKQRITLMPGEYKIEIDPDGKYAGDTSLTVSLEAGKNIYLRVDTKLAIKNSAKFEPYQRTFNLVKTDESLAITQIGECCTTNDKKEKTIEQKVTEQHPKDEFSVDKTQNPFSH